MKKLFLTLILGAAATTGFAAWHTVGAPSGKDLLCISFGSRLVAYIGGADSTLLKTVDGGKTWSKTGTSGIKFSAPSDDIIDINFVSATVGYAVVANNSKPVYTGTIYKTTDGGVNWTLSTDVNVACRKTFFFDEDNGVQVGAAFFSGYNISRMVAGKWQEPVMMSLNPDSALYAVDFFNKTTGIVGGDNGLVHRTFDGGISWDTVQTIVSSRINELLYLDENIIVAATDAPISALIVSKNKGLDWEYDPSSSTFFYQPSMKAVVRSGKDSLIVAGTSNTSGKGMIFMLHGSFTGIENAPQKLNDVVMADDSVAYVVGDSGLIQTNYIVTTGMRGVSVPGFSMYPNPAGHVVYVQAAEEHSVCVLDLMGRQVVAASGFARSHTINVDHVASGTYSVLLALRDGRTYTVPVVVR